MTDERQEWLTEIRVRLSAAVAALLSIPSTTGPWAGDLEAAGEIVNIIKRLGPEESATAQLAKADAALGWKGSGKGRIERIEELTKS